MKHIIILGDGMADHAIGRLGGKTPLQCANTPCMDMLARMGRTGRLSTIPPGYAPGSEVANTAILGYDLDRVYEGRGPLEAASIGYDMQPGDMAMRCNIISLDNGLIKNHHGGHLTTEEGRQLIEYLDAKLGSERVKFIPGIQYRHLLVIKGGNKHIACAPPHDHPDEPWQPLMVKACGNDEAHDGCRMSPEDTSELINQLILKSQALLDAHPLNRGRVCKANSIWPWSPGYRPSMQPLSATYPQIKSGAVISAVDLIRGIGHYAGLRNIIVDGATGLANTNYEGKAKAAIEALQNNDFVFLHVEASDEAGHDGDLDLKMRTIEYLDKRIVEPIYSATEAWHEPVCMAVMPDHPTPVELRTHVSEPVPFLIYHRGIAPDSVGAYDERSCMAGAYGLLHLQEFMHAFMAIN